MCTYMGAYYNADSRPMPRFQRAYPRIRPLLLMELRVRRAEGSIRDDRNCEGRTEIAGVPSSGHVSKDFPRTQESSPSPLARAVSRTPRETGGDRGRMEEQSYDPVVPAKVGNRRASERSGHGTHWREGGNKVTYLLKET